MKLEKGLYSDSSETDQPQGTYRFAKNIIDSNVLGAKENEDGFSNLGVLTPYTLIGNVPVGEAVVVFSTDNTNSEIGLITKSGSIAVYTPVYNNSALNFDTGYPITGEYRKDVNGDRVVAFRDSINVPRIINIDDTSGVNDIEDLALFQHPDNPILTTPVINDSGGSLLTSAITVITKYRNADGSETDWFVHDHVFYINDEAKSLPFEQDDGAVGGTLSNKSISFTLTGSDTRFDTIVVGYIQSVNEIITAKEAYSTQNSATLNLTITGSETTTDVALGEILTARASYNTAKTMTQLAGRLYLANLTADSFPELQEAALGITVNYSTDLINVISNTNSHKDSLPPTLIPGEVYALYLGVELLSGGYAYYHIPGRAPVVSETDIITNEGMTFKRFQINNTSNAFAATSNTGYWENSNEVYPNDPVYGSLIGQPIRHHRMPTVDYLINTIYSGNGSVGVSYLPRVYLSISNVNIPSQIQSQIKGYKIFYAKKDKTNSLFVGSDLLQFGIPTSADSTVRWGTGGNWTLDCTGPSGWDDFGAVQRDTIRGHSLDLLVDGSNTPTYATFSHKLSRNNLGLTYAGFRSEGMIMTITGTNRGGVVSGVIDFTVPTTVRSNASFYKKLNGFRYLPPNSIDGKFRTQYTEGVFIADINNPSTSFNGIATGTMRTFALSNNGLDNPFPALEETMYMHYYRLLTDVHVSYTTQSLIPLEGTSSPSASSTLAIGGDGFLCFMSYLAAGPMNSNATATIDNPYKDGVRVWKAYIGYAKRNFNYRHQTTGDLSTYYYGKTDVRSLFTPYAVIQNVFHESIYSLDMGSNVVKYNNDYNKFNEFNVGTIWYPALNLATTAPNTIIYSTVQNEESKEFSWRTFLAGDRYVTPKNKGDIINIEGLNGKELLISTQYSLYKTRTDIRVATDTDENVYFKSADIFDLGVEEIVPTSSGYAGTQNQLSCKLTKVGYAFVDDLQGKIFLYDGSTLDEISSNGERQFFRDFMQLKSDNNDNPYTQNGYTLGYDERINRLIVSKNYGSLSWTKSYNPTKKTWVSYHDYVPDALFTTVDNILWSVKDNVFYWNNIPTVNSVKGRFYGSTVYPSYLDVVHNEEPYKDKIFTDLAWVTEVYPNTYVTGQPASALDYPSTLTHLTLRTLQHCTGRIPLSLKTDFDSLYSSNIRNLNRTWYFNEIRDIALQTGFVFGFYQNYEIDVSKLNTNMEWYDQRKFNDKFVICRYEYDNVVNNRLLFLESNIQYRDATR